MPPSALGAEAARLRRKANRSRHGSRVAADSSIGLSIRKIRERLGRRDCALAASGAAPLGKELADFYAAIGMPLIEGYGLTEGGVAASESAGPSQSRQHRKGAPGRRRRASPTMANC